MIGRRLRLTALMIGIGALLGSEAGAQSSPPPPLRSFAPAAKRTTPKNEVPESHRPPRGMCRVWIDNVPPAQQPAPTDCPSAIRNRPPNGRVIFSEDDPRAKREDSTATGGEKGRKSRNPGQ